MKEVNIPFTLEMTLACLKGRKFCTTRSEIYGEPGDFFILGDDRRKFRIVAVEQHTLQFVANELWQAEGTSSPQEFRGLWQKLHPRRGFVPSDVKYTHWFTPVEDGDYPLAVANAPQALSATVSEGVGTLPPGPSRRTGGRVRTTKMRKASIICPGNAFERTKKRWI